MEKYYGFKLMDLQAGRLISNQKYQRQLSPSKIKHISDNFNWNLVSPIKVSYRNGSYYVWDGQHTLAAVIAKFGKTAMVPVIVYEGLSYEDEAKLTAELDRFNKKMRKNEIDNAYLESGDKDRKDFISFCEEKGWDASFNVLSTNRKGYVQNISWVFSDVYMKHGRAVTGNFLDVFKISFNGEADAQRSVIQKGVLKFMTLYSNEFEMKRLITVLSGMSPRIIRNNAANDHMHTQTDAVVCLILDLYNKNKKTKLENKIDKKVTA